MVFDPHIPEFKASMDFLGPWKLSFFLETGHIGCNLIAQIALSGNEDMPMILGGNGESAILVNGSGLHNRGHFVQDILNRLRVLQSITGEVLHG